MTTTVCPGCEGSGTCTECNGLRSADCWACDGSGDCPECDGSGETEEEQQ